MRYPSAGPLGPLDTLGILAPGTTRSCRPRTKAMALYSAYARTTRSTASCVALFLSRRGRTFPRGPSAGHRAEALTASNDIKGAKGAMARVVYTLWHARDLRQACLTLPCLCGWPYVSHTS
jgi:hypothetical protein